MSRNHVIPLLLIISLLTNCYFLITSYRSQIVTAVPDGDSLDLADGRRIRLLGTDAPERDRCLYQESRDRLATLALGKRIEIGDVVKDSFGRQLTNVYVGNQWINEVMVEEGFSRYTSVATKGPTLRGSDPEGIVKASDRAKAQHLGIFSSVCRSQTPSNPQCQIKGNNRDGNQTYHLPECKNYQQTIIDLSYGDQWFCSEQEALAAGFAKAAGCK